jgi:hypothetical protein
LLDNLNPGIPLPGVGGLLQENNQASFPTATVHALPGGKEYVSFSTPVTTVDINGANGSFALEGFHGSWQSA